MAGDKLPKNAEISGVAVGGLSRSAAIDKLSSDLGRGRTAPIDVTINGETNQVQPADAGLTVDYAASVDAAGGGRSFDPRQIMRVLTGGSATNGHRGWSTRPSWRRRADLAAEADQPPQGRGPGVRRHEVEQNEGPARGHGPAAGGRGTALEDGFLVQPGRSRCRPRSSQPEVTDEEADLVAENFAEPAISAPIKVKAGGAGTFTVSPR